MRQVQGEERRAWLDVLREDEKAIFRAASLASKAADYLLAFQAAEQREAA